MMLGAELDQPQRTKVLQEAANALARGAYHRGLFFMCDPLLDADAARILLARPAR
jgi:hypothetical protein